MVISIPTRPALSRSPSLNAGAPRTFGQLQGESIRPGRPVALHQGLLAIEGGRPEPGSPGRLHFLPAESPAAFLLVALEKSFRLRDARTHDAVSRGKYGCCCPGYRGLRLADDAVPVVDREHLLFTPVDV